MFEQNNKKVVIVAHSLGNWVLMHLKDIIITMIEGTRCIHYFLRFCAKNFSREWISERIHTWIPVGPLWLGAPKSVRATTSGERMGLDAFLFEEEGILLSRCTGQFFKSLRVVFIVLNRKFWLDVSLRCTRLRVHGLCLQKKRSW